MPERLGSTSSSFLNGLKAQDNDTWRRLTLSFGPIIAKRLRRDGVASQDTEDLVQEVLRRALRGIGNFQAGSFRGWMATITKHVAMDHARKLGKQPEAVGGSDHRQRLDQLPEMLLDDGDDFRWAEIVLQVLQVIEEQSDRNTWRYFWETVVEGRSVKEVAQKYGVSISAVYQAKRRVIAAISQQVTERLPHLNRSP